MGTSSLIFQFQKVYSLTNLEVWKIDLEDDPVSKMRTRKQSLKYIMEIVEKRNKLSQIDPNSLLFRPYILSQDLNLQLMLFKRRFLKSLKFLKFIVYSIKNIVDHNKLTSLEEKKKCFYQRNTSFNILI
ncbi:hypothetical protein R3W88_001175 [Solanum pinnatisectum]|uniref:Translocon at the inner envelope membrane of chloroplasts 214 n=1 Tax=Solanum pinnatisectum TaxID=50273 RepID=A0AAV9MI19_9SOLN|nr:hypothetical protein R3W88_001175 [Solanum pinnatisectum]